MNNETHRLFMQDLDRYSDSNLYALAEFYGVIPKREELIEELATAIISHESADMPGHRDQSYFIDAYVEPQYEDEIKDLDIDMIPSEFSDENAYDQYVLARDAYREYTRLANLYPNGIRYAEKYELNISEPLLEKLNRYDRISGKRGGLYGHVGAEKERI